MRAGSAGVPPATTEARIDYRQTTVSVCFPRLPSADLSGFASHANNHFRTYQTPSKSALGALRTGRARAPGVHLASAP